MARNDEYDDEYDDDEYDDEEYDEEEYDDEEEGAVLPGWMGDAPWWAISAVLHLVILLLIGGLVLTETGADAERRTAIMKRHYKPPPYDPTKKRAMKRKTGVIKKKDKKLIKRLRPDKITPDIPKGTSFDNLSNKNLKYKSLVDVFGMAGGAAGAYGHRLGHGSLISEGGSEATEEAVRAALEWLKRHQNADGSWSCHDFVKTCDKSVGPCKNHPKNKAPWGKNDGRGWKDHDIGVTALAILAFTGYGHTHQTGIHKDYVQVLKKALRFMKKVQITGTGDPNYDGCFRFKETIPKDKKKETELDEELAWMYGHAIATMAVGELLALSGDTLGLKDCVENAAMFCLRAQTDGSGWRYSVKSFVPDTSVSGWMVLALKTVKTCRLLELISRPSESELENSFRGALTWFDNATSKETGITGYRAPGDQGSMLTELSEVKGGYPYSKELSCMSAVSVLCRLFAGESRSNEDIKRGVAVLTKHPPKWRQRKGKSLSTINLYYWYYATLAMFQYGGGLWREWNDDMQESLLPTQRTIADVKGGGCEDGSWDPIGEWGMAGGRVYSTAIGALTLEVYYRYERAQEGRGF